MPTKPSLVALRAVLALAVVLATATAGTAATRPVHPYRIATGQRVRLWTPPEHGGLVATNATVTAVDSTGLTVVIKDRTELIAFTDATRMDVRRGWRYMRRAAVVGLVAGAVAGAVLDHGDAGERFGSGALYGGVGAAVGALTAGAIWPARWLPVDLAAIHEPVASRPSGVRVSLTLSF